MPMATATDTDGMIDLAGARGYTLLRAQLEPAGSSARRRIAMRAPPRRPAARRRCNNVTVARYVYLADSRREAMDDLRADINYELGFQMKRGLIRLIKSNYDIGFKGDEVTFDQLAEAGVYYLGDPDKVASQLRDFYEAAGGFGTLLIVTGKDWATREKVFRSALFMEHVAPKLRDSGAGARSRQRAAA